jgi:hypothetical protein
MESESSTTSNTKIHCDEHGASDYCLICQHLEAKSGLEYLACRALPDYPAQAWCKGCDAVLQQEQGWSDRADAEADWKLVCEGCYEQALARNKFESWVEGPEDRTAKDGGSEIQ